MNTENTTATTVTEADIVRLVNHIYGAWTAPYPYPTVAAVQAAIVAGELEPYEEVAEIFRNPPVAAIAAAKGAEAGYVPVEGDDPDEATSAWTWLVCDIMD